MSNQLSRMTFLMQSAVCYNGAQPQVLKYRRAHMLYEACPQLDLSIV